MSNSSFNKHQYQVIRERIFFEHTTPDEREIIKEITLLNTSPNELRTLFLIEYEFMVGLKIYDAKNRELPYYPNDFAIDLLKQEKTSDCMGKSIHQDLLDDMKEKKAFFIWISLPENEPLMPNESMVIKLKYTNTKKTMKMKLNDLKSFFEIPSRLFFNIPKFKVEKIKPENSDYDAFYLVSAPKNYLLKYKINEAKYIDTKGNMNDIEEKKLHKNLDDKILYVRTELVS